VLLITSLSFVLILAGCHTYDFTYSFEETTIEMGVDECYVSGSTVSLDPIVRMGFTTEEEEEDNDESTYYYYQWNLDELTYSLEMLEDGDYVEVESATIEPDIDFGDYNDTHTGTFDYLSGFDFSIFDFEGLEDGEYRYTISVESSYMEFVNVEGTNGRNQGFGPVKTHSVESETTFSVGSCTNDFDGVISLVFVAQEGEHFFTLNALDSNDNVLSFDDVVLFDNTIVRNSDNRNEDFDIEEYLEYESTKELHFVNISRSKEYSYYYKDDISIAFFAIDLNTSYENGYFSFDEWNGNTLKEYFNYFDENNSNYEVAANPDVLEDYYITVKLKGSNVYKDLLVIYGEDTEAPVFTNVPSNQTIELGEDLDLEALKPTASDNLEGDLSDKISLNITDTTSLPVGEHTIVYSVEDMFGNEATTSITVTVLPEDTTAPVITVTGTDFELEQGSVFPDITQYFSVLDDRDGSIALSIEMFTAPVPIDMNVPGTYEVILSVSDSAGNTATESVYFEVIFVDTQAPSISIETGLETTFTEGDPLPDFTTYFTVLDETDGPIAIDSSNLSWDTEYDNNLAGVYVLTLTVSDAAGNQSQETLTFTVEESTSMYSGQVLTSTALSPTEIEVVFDVFMLDNMEADPFAFSVVVDGLLVNVTSVDIYTDNIIVTIDNVISINSVVTVSYMASGMYDLTYDFALIPDFTDQVVDTTNIGQGGGESYTGMLLVASAFDANTIDLVFDVDTLDNSVIDEGAFTILIDGVEATITSSFVSIDMVSFVIVETMDEFTTVEITYSPSGTNDLSYGGILVPSFTDEPVLPPNEGGFPF
jgi:hypothetical protein